MQTMVVTCGLPACGKTTWAKQQLLDEPMRWVRTNKDDIRAMLFGPDFVWSSDLEKIASNAQESIIRTALRGGHDVIVDNTHLSAKAIRRLHDVAESVGNVTVIVRKFDVPLDLCIARDRARSKPVGEQVITDMWKKFLSKSGFPDIPDRVFQSKELGPCTTQNPDLPEAILVDLDGTAALIGNRNVYDASRCDEIDIPNVPVVAAALAMHLHRNTRVIFVSGRDEKYREPTVRFIEKHFRVSGCHDVKSVTSDNKHDMLMPYELHMRSAGDVRKDTLIKREIYEREIFNKVNVLFVIDDRPCVVRMWRNELGLTVFALNDREF